MQRRSNARINLAMAFALVLAVALAGGGAAEEASEEPGATVAPNGEDGGGQQEDGAVGAAGLRVYLDPETGELRSRPADADSGPETGRGGLTPQERLNTYGGDLLQERLEKGGFKVDLRGRFQRSVVLTIDPQSDAVSIDCVSEAATVEAAIEGEAADGE